ncbi:MAG: globin domain-containing protein [Sulfuricurvum sp.]|nr:globin domain-containing protein [Sulfuricurvum sp.]
MSLSPSTITTVKATAGVVATHAEAITMKMYEILFSEYPETKDFFKDADPMQHKKLASAVSAYAANIDNLEVLTQAVEKMAQTHVKSSVKPEHYPIVGVCILKAIKEVLGDTATDEILEAWKEAYFFLADILIAREKEIYAA